MQKLQFEMRTAHMMAAMVLRREVEKLALFKSDKEVWEAKWKLYETKRRWPSLAMTKEEEELITGRQSREAALTMAGTVNASMLGGREALVPQRDNIPAIRKKLPEKEKEERDRRERHALDSARIAERTIGGVSGGRSNAPEALKERMLVLKQRLEEELAKRKAADAEWDDALDVSSDSSVFFTRKLHTDVFSVVLSAFTPITVSACFPSPHFARSTVRLRLFARSR